MSIVAPRCSLRCSPFHFTRSLVCRCCIVPSDLFHTVHKDGCMFEERNMDVLMLFWESGLPRADLAAMSDKEIASFLGIVKVESAFF